jgi:hypothetical protein
VPPEKVANFESQAQTIYLQYADVFEMIRYGKYGSVLRDYDETNGYFKTKGIVLDGGRIKTEPWFVFQELENALGLNPYFSKDSFARRPDGYFCVKNEKNLQKFNGELDCMPASKGRTAATDLLYAISEETKKMLTDYYQESIEKIEKVYDLKFSWNYKNFKIIPFSQSPLKTGHAVKEIPGN